MGKRKRRTDQDTHPPNCSTSDLMPRSSGINISSKEKSFHIAEKGPPKPLTSIADGSEKLPSPGPSQPYHQPNLSRSIFLKRSRNLYGYQYSRRNSAYHADTSTSHGKGTLFCGERPSTKMGSQCDPEPGQQRESREKAISRAERLRTSAVVVHGGSTEGMKMLCGLCQNLLRRKPYSVDSTQSSSGNLSVVAVLVCSHVYHADCLEQRTTYQDRRDPPCPLCAGSPSNVDA